MAGRSLLLILLLLGTCLPALCQKNNNEEWTAVESTPSSDVGGARPREFQDDDLCQVLRLLARQARTNIVVADGIVGTVTMRLEHKTALEAMEIIVAAQKLSMKNVNGTYFIEPGPGYIPTKRAELTLINNLVSVMQLNIPNKSIPIIVIFAFGIFHLVGAICTAFTNLGRLIHPSFVKRLGLLIFFGPFAATIALRNSKRSSPNSPPPPLP